MADTKETAAAVATEAAAEAAKETATAIAAVTEAAETAVEHATNRADAAQEAANQLADAVAATELGRRIADIDERTSKWHGESQLKNSALETEVAGLRNLMTEMQSKMTEILSKALTPPPPPNNPPPPLKTTEVKGPQGETVESAVQTLEKSADHAEKSVKRIWM